MQHATHDSRTPHPYLEELVNALTHGVGWPGCPVQGRPYRRGCVLVRREYACARLQVCDWMPASGVDLMFVVAEKRSSPA
ncbi:hypothetical protein [Thermomonas hydrothermalis]|uniref:hypothetical protein n=1 Tax=Thermomonas hydrothermalis TaxID=213588 RepID=UPI002354FBBC|nr:hypothetical protein [Thermomonas hydrothermalis]